MPEALLAIDAGTTNVRVLIFGLDGAVRVRENLPVSYPGPGRVEQDPDEIWRITQTLLHAALGNAKLRASDIAAIGIAAQRASCMVWERTTGRALTPLASWQDLRGANRSEALRNAGFLVLQQSAAAKLEAVLDSIPRGRSRAAAGELAWGNIDSYLLYRLSGGAIHATDPSQACATGYYDFATGDWNSKLIEYQHLSPKLFPTLVDTSGHLADTHTGLFDARIPIAAIVGDQQSAAIAQCCRAPGYGKVTYGTSATADVHTGAAPVVIRGTYPLVLSRRQGLTEYCAEGMVITAGAVFDWLNSLGLYDRSHAQNMPEDTAGVFMLPALQGLGSPHGNSNSRARLTGLSRSTRREHIIRAAMEGIAFRVREVLDTIYAHPKLPRPDFLLADGGASQNVAFMQIQADLLGQPVHGMIPHEATAVGAAYLAGQAVGLKWLSATLVGDRSFCHFSPRLSADERDARFARWRDACGLPTI